MLKIVKWPNEVLNTPCPPVEEFNDDLKKLAKDMLATLKFSRGLGLAAPQVGCTVRMCIVIIDGMPTIMVNPSIIEAGGWIKRFDERCLSFPGRKAFTKRKVRVVVRFRDLDGAIQEAIALGVESVCAQHEIDHLNGKLLHQHGGIQKI